MKWNILASWAAHAVTLVVGFLLMPFVLRTLGDRAYGGWIFINSIASYAGLMYLGFGDTISRFVATDHARRDWVRLNQTVNVVFCVYSIMAATALLIAGVLAWNADRWHAWEGASLTEIRLVILILGVNIAIGMVGSVFGGVLHGIQRFDMLSKVGIALDLCRAALTWCFLQRESGLLTLALIFLFITVVDNVVCAWAAWRYVPELRFHRRYITLSGLRENMQFSVFAFLGAIASQLIYATDTVVIGALLGAEAIVPYFIALRLCQYARRPIEQIGSVCMPRAGELHALEDRRSLHGLLVNSAGVSFMLTSGLLIGTYFFGDALLSLWVGAGYAESRLILLVLLGSQVIALPTGVLRSILFGMGHVRVPAILYFAEALANLGLSLLLIGPLGIMGVALGTAIPIVVVEAGILFPFACRKVGLSWRAMLGGIGMPGSLSLAALVSFCLWFRVNFNSPESWIGLSTVTVVGGSVLTGTWWLCHRTRRERITAPPVAPAPLLPELVKE
jgi:O-antigen/teichoic acid export membrane protein